ncbi:oxidoreductase domain protein [Mycobacterium xenopi 3993]|nr:oxidoreductase domain protein [Mycobacterium xenopi 3993]
MFGLVLLATLPIVIVTGLLSYVAYAPQLGQAIPPRWAGCGCPPSTGQPALRGCTG